MNQEIDVYTIERLAYSLRKKLGFNNEEPIDFDKIKNQLNKVSYINFPLSRHFCGLIYKLDTESAVIAINSKITLGRKNFTFIHELYHYFHSTSDTNVCSFNEDFMKLKKDLNEVNADRFASYFLMPRFAFLDFYETECDNQLNEESIIKLENHFKVNRYTVVSRLKKELALNNTQAKALLALHIDLVDKLGYSHDLYEAKQTNAINVEGHYIDLCKKLLLENKISEGKYDEMMSVLID